jgi:hypothetical protein
MTRADELEAVARAMCLIDGVDPDATIDTVGRAPEPAWCSYRERVRCELTRSGAPYRMDAHDQALTVRPGWTPEHHQMVKCYSANSDAGCLDAVLSLRERPVSASERRGLRKP